VQASERTALVRLLTIYRSLARRRACACAAIFLLTLLLRAALLPWLPIPKPVIHDEFSYLLAGDTYAHGRLTNPPHPFWQHFETFHELQQPTYASKYQPLQGLTLAFGERFFNQPWIGVFLSTALMCASICWMLQGWIAPEWALLGAFLFTLRIGVLSYWMNSYEGGSVPAIGGALAVGAVARIWRGSEHGRAELGHAVTWAIGISVLMLSRPYDAALFAISSAALVAWMHRKSTRLFFRAAVPALIVLSVTLAAIAYTDYRVTGNALSLPYLVYEQQYGVASTFFMLPPRPEPRYRHAVMRDFFARSDMERWEESRTALVAQFLAKAYIPSDFFFGFWPLAVPLLLAPFALKTTEERVCAGLLAACLVPLELLMAVLPHYAAAFAGVFYLRFLQSLKHLSAWKKPFGPLLAAAVPTLFVLAFLNSAIGLARAGGEPVPLAHGRDSFSRVLAERGSRFGAARDAMDRDLAALPGGQLVLVRYQPGHDPRGLEWVFNHADIDGSRVVWAREMSPAEDAPFLDYYRERHVWLVEPDATPPRLTPYSAAQPVLSDATVAIKASLP